MDTEPDEEYTDYGYVVVNVMTGHPVVGRYRPVSLRFAERAMQKLDPYQYAIRKASDV